MAQEQAKTQAANIERGSPPKRLNKNNHKCEKGNLFPTAELNHPLKTQIQINF